MEKVKNIVCFITIVIVSFGQLALAQKSFHATHFVYDSAIGIRWYPSNLNVWKSMFAHGVIAERSILFHEKSGSVGKTVELFRDTFFMNKKVVLDSIMSNSSPYGLVYNSLNLHTGDLNNLKDYNANLEEVSNSFLFSMLLVHADMELASNFGLSLVDKEIQNGTWYHYRIFLNNADYTDTLELFAESGNPTRLIAPTKPKVVRFNKEIQISWDNAVVNTTLYGFHIERSINGGLDFHQITEAPIYYGTNSNSVESIYTDSIATDLQYVIYRFVALSSFTNTRIISDTTQFYQNNVELFYPTQLSILKDGTMQKLQWNYPIDKNEMVVNFEIYKSDTMDGIKQKVGEVDSVSREFVLSSSESAGYYNVVAIYNNGNLAPSNDLFIAGMDTIPPSKVSVIYANCDTTGLVSILWNSGNETDLLGYQVYSANSRSAEFSNLSPNWKSDTVYKEQLDLNWMRDSVYYSIKVADLRYNEAKTNDIIAVAIPNKYKPEIPLILEGRQVENQVMLKCVGSGKQNLNYKLFRKVKSEDWQLLSSGLAEAEFGVVDSNINTHGLFQYRLQLANMSGLNSDYSPVESINVEESPWLPKINITEQWDDTLLKHYYLKWNKSDLSIQSFRIIYSQNGRTETVGIVDGNSTEFVYKYNTLQPGFGFIIVGYAMDGRKSKI